MMNGQEESSVAAALLFSFLMISSPIGRASSQVENWIELGTDSEDTAWSYVLLAKDTVMLGANSKVRSGDIGANIGDVGRVTVTIGVNAKVSGSKVKGDHIWLKANSEVWDVQYNQIKKGKNAIVHGSESALPYLPVASLPYLPTFSPGAADTTVNVGQTYVLDEGDYGNVIAKTNAELIFSGGIYNLKSLVASANARLCFKTPSEVRIGDRLAIGPRSKVGPHPGSGIDASDIIIFVNGNDGSMKAVEGVNTDIDANIYAPNGTIWLKTNTDATGSYIAKNIRIGENVTLTLASAFADYAAADELGLYFHNDGTYAYFNETFVDDPIPSAFTYTVYLDKPAERRYPKDFRLVYSSDAADLERWDGSNWRHVEDIPVTVDGRSVVFRVPLLSIANPDIQEDTKVWFVQYLGCDSYEFEVDWAPDVGNYFISSDVIPNLPWPTPLIFVSAVTASVYFIYKRMFKWNG